MPHTSSRYQQDLGFNDAYIFLPPQEVFSASGVQALTRNAAGDISVNIGATVTAILDLALNDGQMMRTGFFEDTQNFFGGTGIAASAQPSPYRPDVIGAMSALQEITPRTALKLKGIKPIAMKIAYLISGAALTLHTVRVDKTIFANNVANAITSVVANGANGLATATQANPYVTTVAFPANQQIYSVSDLSEIWVEIAATTQAAGAYRFYGIELQLEYNFN